jgi:hypothetical protein
MPAPRSGFRASAQRHPREISARPCPKRRRAAVFERNHHTVTLSIIGALAGSTRARQMIVFSLA